MRNLLFILLLSLCAYGQVSVFSADTAAVSNTDTLTGRWIKYNWPASVKGQASLFVAGKKLSGTQSKYLQVEVQTASGIVPATGDTLAGQWQFADSVATTYLDLTLETPSVLNGYWINLADKLTVWQKHQLIRFRFFFKGGTHKTRLVPQFDTN